MRESAKWKLAEVFRKRVQERKSAESPEKSKRLGIGLGL